MKKYHVLKTECRKILSETQKDGVVSQLMNKKLKEMRSME